MRISLALHPKWLHNVTREGFDLSSSEVGAQGVIFDDPEHAGDVRIYWFANPLLGAPPVPADVAPLDRWHRRGYTFGDLELTRCVRAGEASDL